MAEPVFIEKSPHHDFHSDEQFSTEPDESMTLADLYSRMPPPPPRPPSIASLSSRTSNNRPLSSVSQASSYQTQSQSQSQSQPQSNPSYGLTPPSPRVAMAMAQQRGDRDSKHSLLNEEQRQSWQSFTQSLNNGPVSVSARSSLRQANDASGNSTGTRRRTSRRDNDLKGIGIERIPLPSSSSSSSLRNGTSLPAGSSVKDESKAQKSDGISLKKRVSSGFEAITSFVGELANAVLMLLMFLLLSLQGSLTPIPKKPKALPIPSRPRPLSTAASTTASPAAGPGSLAERFKYVICTSFLLAPSISISFYDDAPPLVNDPEADAEAEAELEAHAKQRIGTSSSPGSSKTIQFLPPQDDKIQAVISCVCNAANSNSPPPPSTWTLLSDRSPKHRFSTSNLPTLTPLGSQLRLSCLLACISYRLFTSNWEQWFQAALLLSCVVWSVFLTPSLGLTFSTEDKLHFSLSLAPHPELLQSELGRKATAYVHPGSPPRPLLRYAIPGRLTPGDKARLASEAVKSARDLVLAAHAFDRSVNAGIGAIQEVELVARGYKITHPLPPISRIEAGSSSLAAYHSSPPRSRSPYGSAPPNGINAHDQDARFSNSSPHSTAFNMLSSRRHNPKSMSFSGMPSPAGLGEGEAPSFSSQQEPRRLAPLRSAINEVLSSADRTCRAFNSQLSSLVEKEEFGLLSEMYSLDGSHGEGLNHSSSIGSSLADNSGNNENQPAASDVEEMEDQRTSWSSGGARGSFANNWQTTPRNFGSSSSKRVSLLHDGPFDLSNSSSANNNNSSGNKQKRLSLLSDGSAADRDKERERGAVSPVVPGSRSNRNSFQVDSSTSPRVGSTSAMGGSVGKRGSRLGYVLDGVSKGPNESAASKRLSYTSSNNGSNPIRSNYASSATASFGDTSATSIATGTGTQDTSVSGKRLSLLGLSPSTAFNEPVSPARSVTAATLSPLLLDPHSLMSLKSSFESFHSTRRRSLCHLLALDFTLSDKVTGGDKDILDMELQDYWDTILRSMKDMVKCFEEKKALVDQKVKSAFDPGAEKRSCQKSGLLAPPGQVESGPTKGAFGHIGLEDRIGVMAVSLRALQSKLSACSEDLHLKSPAHLHGESPSNSTSSESSISKPQDSAKSNMRGDAELSAKQEQVERVFESIQEELLSLSAEWEAGLKILKKEKVRSVSPSFSEHLRPSSTTRGLDSPQEVEEDALQNTSGSKPWRKSDSTSESSDGPPDPPSGRSLYSLRHLEGRDGTSETLVPSNLKTMTNENGIENGLDDEMSDLAQLLLNSTSPDHLPPPGLEQVFESIAGMADSHFKKDDLSKLSREERIKKAKEQRAEALLQQNAKRDQANREESDGIEPLGMVKELKDVIKARRESRLAGQSTTSSSQSPNHEQRPDPSAYDQPNPDENGNSHQLGSPLELESNGTFASNSASIASVLSARLAGSSAPDSIPSTIHPSSSSASVSQEQGSETSPTASTKSRSRQRRSSEAANRNRHSIVMDDKFSHNKVWRNSQDLLNGFNLESLDSNSKEQREDQSSRGVVDES